MITPEERFIQECWQIALRENRASVSLFQRSLGLGFTTACYVIHALEERGLITKSNDMNESRRLRISSWSRQFILGREFTIREAIS